MATSLSVTQSEYVCTDSQCLAELSTMFPNLEYSLLVSVLQAHNGRMDTTVEYLMDNSNISVPINHATVPALETDSEDPIRDMVGRFSEDIGGLPEMLPSFLYDAPDTLDASDEDSSTTLSRSVSPDSNVNSEDDPLPTYQEACTDADRLPEAVYIEDDVVEVEEYVVEETQEGRVEPVTNKTTESVVKSKKYRKVRKLAGKLKSKTLKVKIAKGKRKSGQSLSARPGYAPFSSDQEFADEEVDGINDTT